MKVELIIKKSNIYIGLTLFILSGYLYAVFGQAMERFFLAISMLVMFQGLICIKVLKKRDLLELLYTLFLLSFIVCTLLFFTVKPLIYASAMFFVLLISRPYSDFLDINCYTSFIFKINYIIILSIFIISIIVNPIEFGGYEGVFANPNAFGILSGMGAIFSLNDIIQGFLETKKNKLIYVLICLFSFFMLMISSCRSALLGVLCSCAYVGIVYILDSKATRKKVGVILLLPFFLLVTIYLLIITGKFNMLFGSFINKFSILLERGDMTNGRTEIWNKILSEAVLFQNGTGKLQSAGTPSHNVYLGLIDGFGIVIGVLFFIYMLALLYKTFKFSHKNKTELFRFYPASTAIYFFCISLFENYLMTYVMISMFLGVDYINLTIKKNKCNDRRQ